MPRSWGTLLVAPSPADLEASRRRREEARKTAERMRQRMQEDSMEERRFLEYVASHQGTSSKGAYRALEMKNATNAGDTRDVLEYGGSIQVVEIRSEKGRVLATKLFITPEGETYLQQLQKEG